MITKKIDNNLSLGLLKSIITHTLAYELERPSDHYPAFLALASPNPVVNECGHPVQLGIGESGGLPYISSAATETAVIFREKLQELYQRILDDR